VSPDVLAPISVIMAFGDDMREVDFVRNPYQPERLTASGLFAARIGKGAKMHRTSGKATLYETMESALQECDLDTTIFYLIPEGCLAFHRSTKLRNRPALIVGWASNYRGTDLGSKQRYHGRID